MRIGKCYVLAAMALAVSGCTGLAREQPSIIERDGIIAISRSADMQTAYIKDSNHPERYCAARASDVADTASQSLSLGAAGDSIGESAGRGAMSLGGRDPAVLIAREMLYRACELSMNLNADADMTLRIYDRFIDAIVTISANQTQQGTSGETLPSGSD